MSEDDRLIRIENKLDKLADAIVGLARVEERTITLFRRVDIVEERQNQSDDRIDVLEKTNLGRSVIYSIFDKITWLAAGAVIVAYITKWLG